MAMKLVSSAFADGEGIPKQYTCEGADISPPLAWDGVPEGTKSFALIVDDPDAPDPKAPKMTWVHWVMYDLTAAARAIGEAANSFPEGTRHGLNDWKRTGYGGPCPPIGVHRYFHKLFAIDCVLGDLGTPTKDALLAAMKGHVLAEAVLMGTYIKSKG
jgi:Raf kinase inhibitor-like YbhB/YbcL family protein